MGQERQFYGIKFPFTTNNVDKFFIDLNETRSDKVASDIAHVILTRKGTRIRMPDFGTNLIEYVFNPNDEMSWEDVESEIRNQVSKYVSNVSIKSVSVVSDEDDDHQIYADIKYGVKKGITEENKRLVIKL